MAPPKGRYYGGGAKKGQKYAKTVRKLASHARALRNEDITAERTMLEIARVAFVDRRGIILKPLQDWTPEEGALLEGFEVIIKNAAAGDNHVDTVHKVHLAKKLGALELLAKHFKLATDRLEITADSALLSRLESARKRVE